MMSKKQGKYELLKEDNSLRKTHIYLQGCLLLALCALSSAAVFLTWTIIYSENLIIPPKLIVIPQIWKERQKYYENLKSYQNIYTKNSFNSNATTFNLSLAFNDCNENLPQNSSRKSSEQRLKELENEKILPSKYGNYIAASENRDWSNEKKIVCYYTTPSLARLKSNRSNLRSVLYPTNIDPHLCTHLNVGIASVVNNTLYIGDDLKISFNQTRLLKKRNKNLKILIWLGGWYLGGFADMVTNHTTRKQFIQSLKYTLETYHLDGIDLDWEFPVTQKNRMHFSQLLHEIRREYQREHRTYILSVAVGAPVEIIDVSYDVEELNNYADFINVMTYDFHFYGKSTPWTGLNAPLYKRNDERGIFSTMNINYSVNFWLAKGLDRNKLIVGLPTYGHTFTLTNVYNTKIGAPSSSYGRVGDFGFASYSEVCWFKRHNIYVHQFFDVDSCSPYMYSGTEWISYDDEKSFECKAKFVKDNNFGGAMIFSLNTDDFGEYCADSSFYNRNVNTNFPLLRKVHSILVD